MTQATCVLMQPGPVPALAPASAAAAPPRVVGPASQGVGAPSPQASANAGSEAHQVRVIPCACECALLCLGNFWPCLLLTFLLAAWPMLLFMSVASQIHNCRGIHFMQVADSGAPVAAAAAASIVPEPVQ